MGKLLIPRQGIANISNEIVVNGAQIFHKHLFGIADYFSTQLEFRTH